MTEAERHGCAFARVVETLLRSGAASIDLVIAPYNSGAVMVRFAEQVAQAQRVPFWPILLLPVFTPYRFAREGKDNEMPYNNAALVPEVRKKLAELPRPPNSVLFLDDEIGNGRAFEECLKVFTAATRENRPREPTSCLIVAEQDGLHASYSFPGVEVRFMPYALRPSPHVSGVIFDLVSTDLRDAFRGVGGGQCDNKQLASILLGLPTKDLVNGVPRITNGLNREAEAAVKNLARWRADFQARLDELIAAAVGYSRTGQSDGRG